jgi:membrane-associated protease RseP (regulator of RpoE activity)
MGPILPACGRFPVEKSSVLLESQLMVTASKVGLILLMVFGSLLLWIGIPVGWLWVGSQVASDSQQTSLGTYLLVLAAIVASMIAVGKGLSKLNQLYGRVTGDDPYVRVRMPWHRSMRGEEDHRPPRQILDVVMVTSVGIALLVFLLWFALFAGSPLPS